MMKIKCYILPKFFSIAHQRYENCKKLIKNKRSNNKVKKILLVDDEPDVLYTIKNILEDSGLQVDRFNDPITALKYYTSNFYDLVILHIKMPTMDGF
jgi:PleD family two-component response regulator